MARHAPPLGRPHQGPDGPRVLFIPDLLSAFECDHIVAQSERVIRPSIVGQDGGFKSRTRTSETGWLNRDRTPILSTVTTSPGPGLPARLLKQP